MSLHSIQSWHVYRCPQCNASNPPKDKFVVVVCKDNKVAWGFFINSNIPAFIARKPELERSQVQITVAEYRFLDHDSYIGCNALKDFFDWELRRHIAEISETTKTRILEAVKDSETLTPKQIEMILTYNA